MFHIGEDGKAHKCEATVRECPLGGAHFETEAEAVAYEASNSAKKYETISTITSKVKSTQLSSHSLKINDVNSASISIEDNFKDENLSAYTNLLKASDFKKASKKFFHTTKKLTYKKVPASDESVNKINSSSVAFFA